MGVPGLEVGNFMDDDFMIEELSEGLFIINCFNFNGSFLDKDILIINQIFYWLSGSIMKIWGIVVFY